MTTQAGTANEWFAKGLRFACTQCGNCCSGPPGTVAFTAGEARQMAAKLGVSKATFYERYARTVDGRWSLRERRTEHGLDCVFLDREQVPGKAICRVYEARPTQCRTWPFWPENLRSKRAWDDVKRVTPCPGMNEGRLVRVEAIRIDRDALPKT